LQNVKILIPANIWLNTLKSPDFIEYLKFIKKFAMIFLKKGDIMKQKFKCFGFLILLAGLCNPVFAQTVAVNSLDTFSTEAPPETISVKLLDPLELSETQILTPGTVISGNLVDVVSPKRLKRDAVFSFSPVTATDENGKSQNLNLNIKASYYEPVDKAEVAKSAALSVGNHFVKGLSIGVAAISGAVKNEEGNRLKSTAVSVYESSPFAIVKKGEDLYIDKDQIFFLKFPSPKKIQAQSKCDDDENIKGQNYSYTIEKE